MVLDAGELQAIADVLFGDYNPSGENSLLHFYAKIVICLLQFIWNEENRTYRYFNGEFTYPFGYGLSYTKFEYSAIQVPSTINTGNGAKVSVGVKEYRKSRRRRVVQLYISYPDTKGKNLYML